MGGAPFYPLMTHFTMPLHAAPEELVALAERWVAAHGLHVSLERYYPRYEPASIPLGDDLRAALAAFAPVRRICLRRDEFDVGAVSDHEHLQRNPESFVVVLEPLTEDGLRATALTAGMGDDDALRWWIGLAREEAARMHRGACAIDPATGTRTRLDDHVHTAGAHELAADGVPMLAPTGRAVFEFDDLPPPPARRP